MAKDFNKITLSSSMSELYEDTNIHKSEGKEVKEVDLVTRYRVNNSTKTVRLDEKIHRKLKQNSVDTGISIFDLCNSYIENGIRESNELRASKEK